MFARCENLEGSVKPLGLPEKRIGAKWKSVEAATKQLRKKNQRFSSGSLVSRRRLMGKAFIFNNYSLGICLNYKLFKQTTLFVLVRKFAPLCRSSKSPIV